MIPENSTAPVAEASEAGKRFARPGTRCDQGKAASAAEQAPTLRLPPRVTAENLLCSRLDHIPLGMLLEGITPTQWRASYDWSRDLGRWLPKPTRYSLKKRLLQKWGPFFEAYRRQTEMVRITIQERQSVVVRRGSVPWEKRKGEPFAWPFTTVRPLFPKPNEPLFRDVPLWPIHDLDEPEEIV